MDSTDWRINLQPATRQRIINKIMETLKRHLPIFGPEGLVELSKIATAFEGKIYTDATSQSDYLRKISMKMLTMEKKPQTTGMANTIQSNSVGSAQNPPGSGQSQIPTRVQSSADVSPPKKNSANFPSALPSISLTHTSTANASGQSTNMQSGIEQNYVRNSVSQGLPSNISSNSQYLYQQHQMPSYSTTQPGQDASDWRWKSTLQPDSRQKQLNRILETLRNCFPICGSVGMVELNKIAELFEEDIYAAATSHSDYLHKIYLKILKMETRSQTAAFHSMQSQVRNQGQYQIPLLNQSRARQQLLSQNTIVNAGGSNFC